MGSLKSLAQGFLVATGLIWLFNIASLIESGDAWLGLMYVNSTYPHIQHNLT